MIDLPRICGTVQECHGAQSSAEGSPAGSPAGSAAGSSTAGSSTEDKSPTPAQSGHTGESRKVTSRTQVGTDTTLCIRQSPDRYFRCVTHGT
jgi:hypothetical protein